MSVSLKAGRLVLAGAAGLAVVAGLVVPASSASAMVPAADSPNVAYAKKRVDYLATMPTTIPIKVTLSKRPPTGKKVFVIQSQVGDWKRWTTAMDAAAKVLGWSSTALSYQSNPADMNGLTQQAIAQGADYIALVSPTFPTNQPAVDAARAANIPVFFLNADILPAGRANWAFANVAAVSEYYPRGQIAADQVIAASNGQAKTLLFNLPAFTAWQVLANGFKAEYAKYCPGCTLDTIDTTIADLVSGKASSTVIAYLRTHPDTNQILCFNGSFCNDFPAKAAAAGITIGKGGIGLSFASAAPSSIPLFASGQAVTGQASPYEYFGWQLIDAMARYSVGDSLVPNWKARVPIYLYNLKNSPAGTQSYAGPINYTGQFKKLWRR